MKKTSSAQAILSQKQKSCNGYNMQQAVGSLRFLNPQDLGPYHLWDIPCVGYGVHLLTHVTLQPS